MKSLTVCVLLVLFVVPSLSLKFFLNDGEERCLSEDVVKGDSIRGDYSVNPSDQDVRILVNDPQQRVLAPPIQNTKEGDKFFQFYADEPGEYRICFTGIGPLTKTVSLNLKTGSETKDYATVAKKENLQTTEIELRRLEDTVNSIYNEMVYLKKREEEMRSTNDSTQWRVIGLGFLSMAVLVALSAAQIWYLKRYFQSKKLIPKNA